ncbi:MAG: hypothetical protein IT429_23020 [Gemmataceae bacterium]|nr:hypothetical protein [Gemmataceae bacterium]
MAFRKTWRRLVEHLRRERAGTPPAVCAPRGRFRPLLEALEDRVVPANFFVSTQGIDAPDRGSQATPFRTIQFAVNQAHSGDRLHVAQGVYGYNPAADQLSGFLGVTAAVTVFDKSLEIFGGFDNGFTAMNPTQFQTIVDGGNALRAVFVLAANADINFRMEGFTIQSGLARGEARLTGQDQHFAFGGGMWINTAGRQNSGTPGSITLNNLLFRANRAIGNDLPGQEEGGAGAGGALALRFVRNVSMTGVTFENNLAQGGTGGVRGGDGVGGGLHVDRSTVNGTTLTFANNRAVAGNTNGAGQTGAGRRADGVGGGAGIQNGSTVILTGVTATGNLAQGGNAPNGQAGSGQGGVFLAEDSDLTVQDANLRNNTARGGDGRDGGLSGGGAVVSDAANVTLDRVQVINNLSLAGNGSNLAGSPGGGGLYFVSVNRTRRTINITNTIVADNEIRFQSGNTIIGGGGGGIWLQGVAATITHATIANNRIDPNLFFGQAMILLNDAAPQPTTATVAFSIIANHTNSNNPLAPAVDVRSQNGRNILTYNVSMYANNTKDDNSDGTPDPAGTFNGLNTMIRVASAGFTSPGLPNSDYHILASSPARDAASGSTQTLDFERQTRSGVPDLGADEFGTAPPVLPPPPPPPPPPPGSTTRVLNRDSIGVVDRDSNWFLRNSNDAGAPDFPVFTYGLTDHQAPGAVLPVVGDWDGHSTSTAAMVECIDDPLGTGEIVLGWKMRNTNSPGAPDLVVIYGASHSIPVAGDWNGDGIDTVGVVEVDTANNQMVWKLRNSNNRGAPDFVFAFGSAFGIPVVGDWDGDGVDTIGVVESQGGVLVWFLRNANTVGAPDIAPFAYGGAGWKPIAGDWNDDGADTVGVFDPNAIWHLRNANTAGAPDAGEFAYGNGDWFPVVGDWDFQPAPVSASREAAAAPATDAVLGESDTDRWFVDPALLALEDPDADSPQP